MCAHACLLVQLAIIRLLVTSHASVLYLGWLVLGPLLTGQSSAATPMGAHACGLLMQLAITRLLVNAIRQFDVLGSACALSFVIASTLLVQVTTICWCRLQQFAGAGCNSLQVQVTAVC